MSVLMNGSGGYTTVVGALTVYLTDSLAPDGVDGTAAITAPATTLSTMSTSWTLPSITLASNEYAAMVYGTTVSSFGTTALPSGAPAITGDSFVSANPLLGNFAAGAWTVDVGVVVTGGTAPTGSANLTVRIWSSPDGVTFTEITAGAQALSTFNLATTGQQNTTLTSSALLTASLAAPAFLYFQFALEVQTGAIPGGCTVALVQDPTNSTFVTPSFSWGMPNVSPMTFACFLYLPVVPGTGLDIAFMLQDAQTGTSPTGFTNYIAVGLGATANWRMLFAGSADATDISLKAAQWLFVAFTVTAGATTGASSALNMYGKIVGAPSLTMAIGQTGSGAPLGFVPAQMELGLANVSGQLNFAGAIASARVWTDVLSVGELEAEARSIVPVRKSELFEHWSLDNPSDLVGRVRQIPLVAAGAGNSQFSDPLPRGATPQTRALRRARAA
jgi:hypothetical protein